jgi:hypothetical protein
MLPGDIDPVVAVVACPPPCLLAPAAPASVAM